eukprot:gb/GECH01013584.1/.p1 GENE.gb/GECH01013584.1/~~gb/GECH01013584.1/.p1  ORF type:complete len:220 (+),score=44.22 gb/GECH01013584.1/:1-660(+)
MSSFVSEMNFGGHIQLIIGPMFAGKTTELIRRIKRYTIAQKKCLLIKYRKDTRYSDDCMATHDRQQVMALPCDQLSETEEIMNKYDVIGIDEGQFFPDVVDFAEKAANAGKVVIVSALSGTFQRRPFGKVLEVIPLAEQITRLTAVCMICHRDASFTRRLIASDDVEVIGGADKYIAVCRECFNKEHLDYTSPIKSPSTEQLLCSGSSLSPSTAKQLKF